MVLKYKCQYCGIDCKNLKRHIKENHTTKKFKCLICGYSTNFNFNKHLIEQHSMSIQKYYDLFYLKSNENLCENCKKPAKFISLNSGYYKTCGDKHCMAKISLNKTIKTLKKKYNVPDEIEITNVSQFKEIQERIAKNNKTKYGVTNTFLIKDKDGVEKRVKTWNKNLGCDYPMQSDIVKKNNVKTCNEKYGCDNVMQDHNIRVSNQSKVEYNNIKFDSKMEVKFYKFLQENNIEFEYQPNIHFEYYDFKNIKHIYEPDFKIGDKI